MGSRRINVTLVGRVGHEIFSPRPPAPHPAPSPILCRLLCSFAAFLLCCFVAYRLCVVVAPFVRTATRASQIMTTAVVTILACVAIPVVCAYRHRAAGPRQQPPRFDTTAQDVHLRRRVQHAASGLGICSGYKWVITDARAGEGKRIASVRGCSLV